MTVSKTTCKLQWTIDTLQEILSDGPVESKKIREVLSGHRIGNKTLKAAKTELDVQEYRKMRLWYWYIKSAPPKPRDKIQQPEVFRRHTLSRWKDEAEEDITGTGIKILNLDHRTVDALKRAGMITVEEVLALENRKALLRIRNIGASSSEKILDALSAQGYDISKFR